jgi:hypothetical protein
VHNLTECITCVINFYKFAPNSLSPFLIAVQHAVPKVVAFDLDATLWYPEMYQASQRAVPP